MVAEKGAVWMKLRATGRPGHGSVPRLPRGAREETNAVARLGAAVAKLAGTRLPQHRTAVVDRYLRDDRQDAAVPQLGAAAAHAQPRRRQLPVASRARQGRGGGAGGRAVEHRGADMVLRPAPRPTSSPA